MEYKHNPPTLQELRQIFTVLTNGQYKPHHAVLTRSERFAVYMHRRIGSLGFFCLILAWTVLWLASNILQLVLLPVIMVGQNIEGRAAEWRAQKDFEVDRQAQQEIEVIIAHLENQNELLLELARKIDRK